MLNKTLQFFGGFALSLTLIGNSAIGAAWNDPNVQLAQRISDRTFVDGANGQIVSTQGMPDNIRHGTAVPGAASSAGTQPPANPAPSNSGGGSGNTGGGNTNAGTTGNGTAPAASASGGKMAKFKSGAKKVGGGVLGAVGLVSGTMGVIDSASGQTEHSWGDVLEGTLSGATAAAGGAAIFNAIPVAGQIGYGIAIATGAVVGGIISGSQLFSETDCLTDPVTGKFTCCHTQFNQGERYADIGDYMFCGVEQNEKMVAVAPGVRQCVQGGSTEKSSWWSGLWKDDAWQPECTPRWCDTPPTDGIDQYLIPTADNENFCWNWDCINGYTKSGNTCIQSDTNTPVIPTDPYENAIKKIRTQQQVIIQRCGYAIGTTPNL